MTMSRSTARGRRDLLVRPPCSSDPDRSWVALVVDPVRQLDELAELHRRGVLTADEFDHQKAKVLGT
jgi:hypothetical protein